MNRSSEQFHMVEQGRQPTEVAKELGICIDTLRSWLKASGVQMGQADRLNREQQRIRELEARPAGATPTTTPWPKISSAVSNFRARFCGKGSLSNGYEYRF